MVTRALRKRFNDLRGQNLSGAEIARKLCDEGIRIEEASHLLTEGEVMATKSDFMGIPTLTIKEEGKSDRRICWLPLKDIRISQSPKESASPPSGGYYDSMFWD